MSGCIHSPHTCVPQEVERKEKWWGQWHYQRKRFWVRHYAVYVRLVHYCWLPLSKQNVYRICDLLCKRFLICKKNVGAFTFMLSPINRILWWMLREKGLTSDSSVDTTFYNQFFENIATAASKICRNIDGYVQLLLFICSHLKLPAWSQCAV